MTSPGDQVPGYRTIRVTAHHAPVAELADAEAWQACDEYPQLSFGGPGFGVAREREEGGWELLRTRTPRGWLGSGLSKRCGRRCRCSAGHRMCGPGAAENFPCTAADAVTAAASFRIQAGRSSTRTVAAQRIRHPGRSL